MNSQYFVADRNGRANSAVFINGGYLQAPSGNYFSGPFSVTAWVNIQSTTGCWSRLFDFAVSYGTRGVFLSLYGCSTKISISGRHADFSSLKSIVYGEWQHIGTTVDGSFVRLYINGYQTSEFTSSDLGLNKTTFSNYIGKSNYPDGSIVGIFDELKFFNRALSNTEILNDLYVSN